MQAGAKRAPHARGSATSEAAARSVDAGLNAMQQEVLRAIEQAGSSGLTCDELEQQLGMRHQTASARVRELTQRQVIVCASTRKTSSGRQANVYVAREHTQHVVPTQTESFGASMRSWKGVQGGRYFLVQTMDQFWEFFRELKKQTFLAVDTETSGLDWVKSHACGIVIGWGVEWNFYLPIAHTTGELQLNLSEIREPLREVLEDRSIRKVLWNEKFDRHFLRKCGIEVRGVRHDGVVLLHLVDENRSHALKDAAKQHISRHADKWEKILDAWRKEEAKRRRTEFGRVITERLKRDREKIEAEYLREHPFQQFEGLKKAQITSALKKYVRQKLEAEDHPYARNKIKDISYDQIPLDTMTPYACADVHYTWLLVKRLIQTIAQHDALKKLYINETALADLLFETETIGVKVDIPYLKSTEPVLVQEMADLKAEIFAEVGYEFDLESNPSLITALRTAGCRLTKLTKKGKELAEKGVKPGPNHFAVDDDTLEGLSIQYKFAGKVREYRKRKKLLDTYVRAIINKVDEDHYIHTTFNANVTTGRMSSKEPNLQNIPGRSDLIRRAFTIPEGIANDNDNSEWVFVFMDYSQVELRLTAHHSQDPTFINAYPWDGSTTDLHSLTCADAVLGRPFDEVLAIVGDEDHPEFKEIKWFRNIAKRVNFGIIYGAGPQAIQRQVSSPERQVSVDECKTYIQNYFRRYPGVKRWIDTTQYVLSRSGYLQNTFGRYRTLHDARAHEKWKRGRAGRQGVNFLIQGDAADLFKHAAVRVYQFLKEQNAKTRIVNFVHDEIQFYWHKDELHLLKPVKELMEDFPQFDVPIVVDVEYSKRCWADKKELKAA